MRMLPSAVNSCVFVFLALVLFAHLAVYAYAAARVAARMLPPARLVHLAAERVHDFVFCL
jgi:hypothetical protein